jgi:hypothetical protein
VSGRFALFADCLLVGILALVAALPVVTAYVAFTAACAVLRDRVASDRSVGPRVYWQVLRSVSASGPAGFLVPPVLAALLVLDLLAILAGVPGAPSLVVLLVVVAGALAVLGLRAAARWRPGDRWPSLVLRAAEGARDDVGGSLLLVLAAGAALGIAVLVPVTVVLLPGPLALAAVAVDGRRP